MPLRLEFIQRTDDSAPSTDADALNREVARSGVWWKWIATETAQGREVVLFVNARKLLAAAAIVVVVGYFGTTGALAWWRARDPYNHVRMADLMLPTRWPTIRVRRGEAYCDRGLAELRGNNPQQAIFYIKLGLSLAPARLDARLELMRYFARFHYYAGVRELALPQFDQAALPHEVLEILFAEAQTAQDQNSVVEFAGRAARHPALTTEDRRWVKLTRAEALLAIDHPAEALTATDDPELLNHIDGQVIRMRALARLGRIDEAIALGRSMPRMAQRMEQPGLRALGNLLAEAQRIDELKVVIKEMIDLNPAGPSSRAAAIESWVRAGRSVEARVELEEYIRRFGVQPNALVNLGRRLADLGSAELTARCQRAAREFGRNDADMLSAPLLVAQFAQGDWAGAGRTFTAVYGNNRSVDLANQVFRELIRAALDAVPANAPLGPLRIAVERRCYFPTVYAELARGFANAGRWDCVQLTAATGLSVYPHSLKLQQLLAQAQDKTAAVGAPVATTDIRASGSRIIDEATFKTTLSSRLAQSDWDAVSRQIEETRRARPDWLPRVAPDLDWAEAEVAYARDDRPRLRQHLTARLRESPDNLDRVLGFARRYQKSGDVAGAKAVAETATTVLPNSLPAMAYLAEIRQASSGGN